MSESSKSATKAFAHVRSKIGGSVLFSRHSGNMRTPQSYVLTVSPDLRSARG